MALGPNTKGCDWSPRLPPMTQRSDVTMGTVLVYLFVGLLLVSLLVGKLVSVLVGLSFQLVNWLVH